MQDAWVFEHSVVCPVAREFAWAFWTEVSNWKLDSDVEAVEIHGPFAVGTRGATISRRSGRIEWQIAEVTPGSSAAYEIALPGAVCRFHWTFSNLADGTRMTQRASLAGESAAMYADGVSALEKGIPAGMQKLADTMAAAK